jgi:hypothetical protein
LNVECTRCGGEAVVKRDNAVYCGKCALARDWQEIIHVVQNDRMSFSSKPPASAPPSKPESAPASDPIAAPEPEEQANPTPPKPEVKADPFA